MIKKILASHKSLLIFLAFGLFAIIGVLYFGYMNDDQNSKDKYYSCIYNSSMRGARCVPNTDDAGCFGNYPLVSNSIKDGIKVNEDMGGTCEGLTSDEYYIFNKTGKYLGTEK